jgi:hypothetical protein
MGPTVNSWAIPIGLATLSLPLIVHWLTRPRPRRYYLSTVRFVREVIQQRRSVSRLRDWLVLLLRLAAILLFAFALARPRFEHGLEAASGGASAQTVRVVILDVSQSMAATSNGIQSLERARPLAASRLSYQSGTVWNLILAGAIPQPVFERPSTNYSTLLGEVARARALPQRLNLQGALNAAGEMLANTGTKVRREVAVISDFQRANWASADFSVLPADAVIQLETVAPVETPANLAILRVGPQQRAEAGRAFRLEFEIGNYSASSRTVTVEAVMGDAVHRVRGTVPPNGRATLVAETTVATAGWIVGEARLVDVQDALAADNARPIVVNVHPQPKYVVLTKQSPTLRPSSSYFLERALSPELPGEGRGGETILHIDPARTTREGIAAGDVLLLDHPGKLSEEMVQWLVAQMRQGRGVLYVAAEPIDATNLKMISRTAGSELQLPVEFSPAGSNRKDLFLSDVKRRQAPFSVFGDEAATILSTVRFSGGLSTRRVGDALLDDVLATYNDQSACLVITSCGAGTLAVLNADLAKSNLPSSPAFVPLVGELTNRLLGSSGAVETVASGEPFAATLPAGAGRFSDLQIVPPASATKESATLGELRDDAVGIMWQSAAAGPPGVYQVKQAGTSIFAVASVIPAEEADLATLAQELLTDRLAGGRDVKFRTGPRSDEPRDDLWTWLTLACLACVVAEVFCLRLFKC